MTQRFLLTFALFGASIFGGCAINERRPEPSNKVAIILDGSITFKARRADAIARASSLLDSISQTKSRRWEKGLFDITIISLDAMPEVIWTGSLQDLKAIKQSDWAERFKARKDYEQCTDVDAAFQLAINHLEGDSQYVSKYIFAFTDLIHEPPAGSIRSCRATARPSLPSDAFPWANLREVSVSVFWVPPDQKLAWQRVATENGLTSNFALYTSSESGQIKLNPPPKPALKITEADRAADRERYTGAFLGIVKWIAFPAIALIALLLFLLTRSGERQGRNSEVGGRPARLPASKLRGAQPPPGPGGPPRQVPPR